MAKRIKVTDSRLKKYAAGATAVPLMLVLFWFLASLGSIDVTGHSEDIICAGTELDPCFAYINFTANEDIFLYPSENWTGGLLVDKPVKSIQMYRSWGKGWREINLTTNCKWTWCGAPDNSGRTVYSYAIREGRDYEFRFKLLKNHPDDNIKWTWATVDPIFYGLNKDSLNKEYDGVNKEIIFKSKIDNKDLMRFKLKSELFESIIRGENRTVAKYTLKNNYGDYPLSSIIGPVQFIDLNTNETVYREYHYERQVLNGYDNVSVYSDVVSCETQNITRANGTEFFQLCSNEIVGFKNEPKYKWSNLNLSEDMPKGEISIRLVTNVYPNEHMEQIPTFNGIKIPEFSEWHEGLELNLVEYWDFEEGSGTNVAGSLNHYNLTSNSSTWLTGKLGTYGMNFSSDNSEKADTMAQVTEISGTNFSVNGWIKINTELDQSSVWKVGKDVNVPDGTIYLLYSSLTGLGLDKWIVNIPNTDSVACSSTNSDVGVYRMMTMVYNINTNNLTIYKDGALDCWVTTTNDYTVGGFWLGFGALPGQPAYGRMVADEVSIWNRTVNSTEIDELYNGGTGITFGVINKEPNIDLILPVNNTNLSTSTITLSVLPKDGDDLTDLNASVYGNWTGWHLNASNTSALNNTLTNFSIAGIPDGKYIWGATVGDTDGANVTNVTNYTFTKDTVVPAISYNPTTESNLSLLSRDWILVNVTATDVNLHSVRLSWQNANETFASNAGDDYWENKSSLSDGNYSFHGWANDSAGNVNFTGNRTVIVDTTNPLISFVDPTKSNATVISNDWIFINVSITELNFNNVTFEVFHTNGTSVESVTFTNSTRQLNVTSLPDDSYNYNVTTFDMVNNSNSTETRHITLINSIPVFFENLLGNISVEVDSVTIKVNETANTTICFDIDDPKFGNNYTCINGVSFTYETNFTKVLFDNGTESLNQSFNFSIGPEVFNVTFAAHQYDEVQSMKFNISGVNNPFDVIIFYANTTPDLSDTSQYIPLIDRWYDGILNGSVIYLNEFDDSNSTKNVTFQNAGNTTVNFILDDIIKVTNLYSFLFNVTGFPFGVDYEIGDSSSETPGFNNFSHIDLSETNAHLDPSGVILAKNVSKQEYIFDDFEDGELDQDIWSNASLVSSTCTIGNPEECVKEEDGYAVLTAASYEDQDRQAYLWNATMDRFILDELNMTVNFTFTGDNPAVGLALGNGSVHYAGRDIWFANQMDSPSKEGETVKANLTIMIYKFNHTHRGYRIWGVQNSTAVGLSDINILYNGTEVLFETSSNLLEFNVSTFSSPTGGGFANATMFVSYVNVSRWTRENSTVVSNSVYDSSGDITKATISILGLENDEAINASMSADNGVNWEDVTGGVEHTFSTTGRNLKWKVDFNLTGELGVDDNTTASYLVKINITTPSGNASNITFDFGDDGSIDANISDFLNLSNSPVTINLSNVNISGAFIQTNIAPKTTTTNYEHTYQIPLVIHSDSIGIVLIDEINLTYDPNPIVINITNVSNTLALSTNYTSFIIPIASSNTTTGTDGNVFFDNLFYDYLGGEWVVNITAHDVNYTINVTHNITFFHSRWDFNFVPSLASFLEFIPSWIDSKNVTPFGQNADTPILNVTNYGYHSSQINLSTYINDTLSCVNLTISTTANKTDGYIVNSTWRNIQENVDYLNTTDIYMWADYDCSFNNWTLFQPSLYFRQCADTDICSEVLV